MSEVLSLDVVTLYFVSQKTVQRQILAGRRQLPAIRNFLFVLVRIKNFLKTIPISRDLSIAKAW